MSRPRSGRAASSAPARGATGGRPGVYVQSPRSDVFVALLGVALGAMIVACILLYLVFHRYGSVKATFLPATAPVRTELATASGKISSIHL